MSGGLKNWFFVLNIREKYFCLLSYLEKLEKKCEKWLLSFARKSTFVTVTKIVGTLISVLYF